MNCAAGIHQKLYPQKEPVIIEAVQPLPRRWRAAAR
jgi:hypothetical protein